jgi:uncharacterized membrane protein
MFSVSLVTLLLSFVSVVLSLNTKEDVVKPVMACSAIIFGLLTLLFAPWQFNLAMVVLFLLVGQTKNRFTGKFF